MRKYSKNIRLFIDTIFVENESFQIIDQQAHYLSNVMRVKMGDTLSVFNGWSGEFEAKIINILKDKIICCCKDKIKEQEDEPKLSLCFSIIKKNRLFSIIEKCTELGVSDFYPIVCARTQFNKINKARMESNSIEAAEQTERLTIPNIESLKKLDELLESWEDDKTLIFCDENGGPPISNVLKGICNSVGILIGPEGGFSEKEQKHIMKHNFVRRASLGPRILRSDTAAIAAVTCYQSISGDWSTYCG